MFKRLDDDLDIDKKFLSWKVFLNVPHPLVIKTKYFKINST